MLLVLLVCCLLCRRCGRGRAYDSQGAKLQATNSKLAQFEPAKPSDGSVPSVGESVDESAGWFAGALNAMDAQAAAEAGMSATPPTLPTTPTAELPEPEAPAAVEVVAPAPTAAARRAAGQLEPKSSPGFWAFAHKAPSGEFGSAGGQAAVVTDVETATLRRQNIDAWLADVVGDRWHGCVMYNDLVPWTGAPSSSLAAPRSIAGRLGEYVVGCLNNRYPQQTHLFLLPGTQQAN